jgi:murein DD-endopeptidase MepM/ murein hydrolase activator NlpD
MREPLAGRPSAGLTNRLGHGSSAGERLRDRRGVMRLTTHEARLWLTARWSDDLLMGRAAAHLAIILLVLAVIVLSSRAPSTRPLAASWRILHRVNTEEDGVSTLPDSQKGNKSVQAATSLSSAGARPSSPLATSLDNDGDVLVRAAVPHTIIPERPRDEIIRYVVQTGDTIFGIAGEFGLAPETIMWANGRLEDNPDLLRVGQELAILPVNGVYHQVGASDTLEAIAAAYKVEPADIINYPLNHLDADNPQITAGQWLIVPGGTKPYVPRTVVAYSGPVPADASKGTGVLGWPTAGQITQGYWEHHRALDIGTWKGAPVLAADSGYVVAAGFDDSGYGRTVVIDHGNGFQTRYAHMQVYYVEVGDSVAKGEQIGEVGSTGNSTGPHLHFEVIQNGVLRNPFGYLP